MSYPTMIGVVFWFAGSFEKIAALARVERSKINDQISPDEHDPKDAQLFLESVASKKCLFSGEKGFTCSWSTISNYGSIADTVEALTPFFLALFQSNGIVMGDDSEILVFECDQESKVTRGIVCHCPVYSHGPRDRIYTREITIQVGFSR